MQELTISGCQFQLRIPETTLHKLLTFLLLAVKKNQIIKADKKHELPNQRCQTKITLEEAEFSSYSLLHMPEPICLGCKRRKIIDTLEFFIAILLLIFRKQ